MVYAAPAYHQKGCLMTACRHIGNRPDLRNFSPVAKVQSRCVQEIAAEQRPVCLQTVPFVKMSTSSAGQAFEGAELIGLLFQQQPAEAHSKKQHIELVGLCPFPAILFPSDPEAQQ